ncbi:MAG: hypothetical protein ACLRZY_14990 [Blautia hansenii]
MAIELVTAYKGKDHVTAEQWADFNRGIYGDAAILPVGNKMETAIQTANQITVKDGVAVIDGRQVYIGYGESENIAIQSGTQGKLRRDIVVLEYKEEEVSGVETVQFKVITGTPADSDAKDPSVQDMDIRTGVFTSQKPFCRVRLNGTAIEGVDTLIPVKEFKPHAFAAPVNNLAGTNPDLALAAPQGRELKKQVDALNSALGNKIIIGSNKDTVLIVTDQTINFLNGQGTVNVSSIASAYSKTVRNAIVQLKSASSAVVTSATVSENKVAVKCSNLSGTAFTGNIDTTVLLFMY